MQRYDIFPRKAGSLSNAEINRTMSWCHRSSEPLFKRYLMRNCFIGRSFRLVGPPPVWHGAKLRMAAFGKCRGELASMDKNDTVQVRSIAVLRRSEAGRCRDQNQRRNAVARLRHFRR